MINLSMFSTLQLRDNDVVVLRTDITDAEQEALTVALQDYLLKASLDNVLLIILKPHESIRTISDAEMLAQGWRRRVDWGKMLRGK